MERIGGLYAERLKIPKSSFQRATMVQNIVKAEAVDPLTVKVTLSKPNSAFFNGLMENRVPLMPKEMDDIGFGDPLKMAGIGAYSGHRVGQGSAHGVQEEPALHGVPLRRAVFR